MYFVFLEEIMIRVPDFISFFNFSKLFLWIFLFNNKFLKGLLSILFLKYSSIVFEIKYLYIEASFGLREIKDTSKYSLLTSSLDFSPIPFPNNKVLFRKIEKSKLLSSLILLNVFISSSIHKISLINQKLLTLQFPYQIYVFYQNLMQE